MNTPSNPFSPVSDGYIGRYKQQTMRKLSGSLHRGPYRTRPVMVCDPSPFEQAL